MYDRGRCCCPLRAASQELGTHSRAASTVFLNHAPSGVADITAQMRNSFMEAQAAGIGKQ